MAINQVTIKIYNTPQRHDGGVLGHLAYSTYVSPYLRVPVSKHMQLRPPRTPLLYDKTGVLRGIHYFFLLLFQIEFWFEYNLL